MSERTETSEYTYLIVGGGMVADSAARGIRELDRDGSIGIIAEEQSPPVTRPALSKKLWTDESFSSEDAVLDPESDADATRLAGERAVEIVRDARVVRTESGLSLHYDHLLLATGGTPTTLGLPEHERILTFRSIDDYRRLRELSGDQRRIAVVGGSFIATELAAALVQNDTATTLVVPERTLFDGVLPADLASRFQALFEEAGVTILTGVTVESAEVGAIGGDDPEVTLVLSDGSTLDAEAAVLGAGVTPNTALAEAAGLEVDDGVVVDSALRTSDPRILAAGDIASYPDRVLGRTRVEHVDNATAMGTQAGRNLAGADEPYAHTPYFYSAVLGTRYEAVGTLDASLETVEVWNGDQGVVHYLDGDRVVGVLLWNIDGRRDDARDAIAHADASDRAALRARIPAEDGDPESDDQG